MSIAEDIDTLNAKVAQLKVEYEQYFMRVLRREPVKLRGEVDRLIRHYSTQHISNTSLKFKYNSVVSKYNAYKQYWTRVLREIEEGTYVRRAEAVSSRIAPPAPPSPTVPPAPPMHSERKKAEAERTPQSSEKSGTDKDLKKLYNEYLNARTKCNEPTKGISYESFTKTVEKSTRKAAEMYKAKDVELKVSIKDGKTKLAITPKKG